MKTAKEIIQELKEIAVEQESEINMIYSDNTKATVKRLENGTFTKDDINTVKFLYDDWNTDFNKIFS